MLLDLQCTLVLLKTVAGKHLHIDDRALGAGRHTQGRILHVRGLLTEDGTQQFLFRCELGLAFRRYLAHQDIARLDLRTDVDNAGLIKLGQRTLTDIGNIRGDFLGAQLGVTRDTGEFLNMNGGETIFLDHLLGHQDGVFEVVAVPGHERNTDILAQRQVAHID